MRTLQCRQAPTHKLRHVTSLFYASLLNAIFAMLALVAHTALHTARYSYQSNMRAARSLSATAGNMDFLSSTEDHSAQQANKQQQ
jgi:CRISPR/Cas system-associated protein endoribonuclease Cas2